MLIYTNSSDKLPFALLVDANFTKEMEQETHINILIYTNTSDKWPLALFVDLCEFRFLKCVKSKFRYTKLPGYWKTVQE